MEMKLAGRVCRDARIDGLDFGSELERIEIDWTHDSHAGHLVLQTCTGLNAV
jgi:hypothetical protein